MGPEKWKGELPPDEAAGSEAGARREDLEGERGAEHPSIDAREEEGYSQPESSAQKDAPPGPGDGEPARE